MAPTTGSQARGAGALPDPLHPPLRPLPPREIVDADKAKASNNWRPLPRRDPIASEMSLVDHAGLTKLSTPMQMLTARPA